MRKQIESTLKRAIDVGISVSGLLLLSPVIIAIFAAVMSKMGAPVIFRQQRPGRGGQMFTLYKFRTMTNIVDANGHALSDDDRLTPLGLFLRKWSLDEIPQLWNVLKGEMSIVGPRPLLDRYLLLYTAGQARRHEVKPGITGWAQIHGRRTLDENWDEKFRLDVWYVDNWSIWLDVQILAHTALQVVRHKDISQSGKSTSDEFRGANDS